MVAGYHLLWTAYGWWLPNDPRGSTSTTVTSPAIRELGALHYGRKRMQPTRKVLREFQRAAALVLREPPLLFGDQEVAAIGNAFAQVIRSRNYTCYACAVMPDHVHLLIRKHRDSAEMMIEALQDASRDAVRECGQRYPLHPVWTDGGWKGFLETRADFQRIIRYIRENPLKISLPLQHWDFVQPYNGWLPGIVTIKRAR